VFLFVLRDKADWVAVEKEITLQIDDIVQAQVAACLQTHIPKELQDEVEDNKQELERARIALHNSYVFQHNPLVVKTFN
jgi:hypothetical protein